MTVLSRIQKKLRRYASRIRNAAPHICALAYHSVGSSDTPLTVTAGVFEQHMQRVAQIGHPISAGQLREFLAGGELPPRPVLVTFDDGYRDILTTALPILERYGVPALVFLCTGFIGAKMPLYAEMLPALSWDEVREMHRSGVVEFGAHTRTHPRLSEVSPEVARKTIRDSKQDIEGALNRSIDAFCYPHGRFNDAVVHIVRQEGFRMAFAGEGWIDRTTPSLLLPRVQVHSALGVDALGVELASCFRNQTE